MKKPDSSQGLVQRILDTATKDCDSPDVRDRAYIYWRLLSTDPSAAKVRELNEDCCSVIKLLSIYALVCHPCSSASDIASTDNRVSRVA